MPSIVVDATKPIVIKNPVVKSVKDSEGSPKPLETPLPVTDFTVEIEDEEGNFGTVTAQEDGSWLFDPGNEVDEQASGTLVFSGNVEFEGETIAVTGSIDVELEPGEGVAFGAIEPELEVVDPE